MKSGTIVVGSGHASQTAENENVSDKVAPPRPTTDNLGNVVKLALAGLSVSGIALVDFTGRKVGIATHSADYYSALAKKVVGLSGDWFEFIPSDPTKSSSPWSIKKNNAAIGQTLTGSVPTGLGLLLSEALGYQSPARSLSSLVGSIEDALTEAGLDGFAVIDQVAEKVILGVTTDLSGDWADPTSAMFNAALPLDSETVHVSSGADDVVDVAPTLGDGPYFIEDGDEIGNTVDFTGVNASGPVGEVDTDVTVHKLVNSTTRKVAIISQTVSSEESSATGMFQS